MKEENLFQQNSKTSIRRKISRLNILRCIYMKKIALYRGDGEKLS